MEPTSFSALKNRKFPSLFRSRQGWADYFEAKRSPEPHLHQIEPTNCCPYHCIMCPRAQKMTRKTGFMDLDVYKKVIDEVATFAEPVRSKEIELFHFGESLLHPQIVDMIEYASDRTLNITLSVNAPQLQPQLARQILQARPFKIIISLDGYDEASYRSIRGQGADYGKAVENLNAFIRLFQEMKTECHVIVRMIRLHVNEAGIASFKNQWESEDVRVEIRDFFPWNSKEMVPLGTFEKFPAFMPCPFCWQYVAVQWNGDVVPCCRDYNGVLKMGNVRDNTLREIWNGARYGEFRRQMAGGDMRENPICPECLEIYYTEE